MIPTRSFALGREFSPVHFVLYYSMRLVPYAAPRRAVAALIAKCIEVSSPPAAPILIPADETTKTRIACEALQTLGVAALAPILSHEQIDDIMNFIADKPTVSEAVAFLPGKAPAGVARASYPLPVLLACPHILAAINRSAVLRIARSYLGCRPTISGIGLHWSFPTAVGCDVQHFHRDPDDWRFLKLFCYLNDVDELNGPHEFVQRSHRTSGRFRSRPYSSEEVESTHGKQALLRVVGPAGTTFMADTWGIHRGAVPLRRARLMLQVTYSVLPIAKFRYQPQKVGPLMFDRYTNRMLIHE